ncbi:MAG: GNAT family N-acetyltransferase [Polaromonas sp.]|nr:GNAT family N-acetyltransferase [Polaromonas sp.]
MKVLWDGHDMAAWDSAHALAAAPLQQDWAYGSSMQMIGVPVLRARVEVDGVPVALAQFIVRRWGTLLSVGLCSRGPIWLVAMTAQDKARIYAEMRRSVPLTGLRWLLITPEEVRSDSLGLSKWRRVMTGYATVLLDISQSRDVLRAALDAKWRNRLVAAESSALAVHRVGSNPGQYRWLLDHEETQREQRGFAGLPRPFYDIYIQSRQQPAQTLLTLRADLGRERVAGMMFLIHGEAATYQVGWSNEQGRQLNAHNLLLWNAIEALQQRGVRCLDLGGVNTARSAGIARFKIGTGGDVRILAGTYF